MIKPLTEAELARYDAALAKYLASELICEGEWIAAMRERLRIAEEARDTYLADVKKAEARVAEVEMYAGSDREERQFWESRYVDVRDYLRLADVVVDLATTITPDSGLNQWDQLHAAIGVYLTAREPK